MKLIRDIGIDLGTANVLCYEEGRGIVLREPSVVAVDKNTGKVLQVGSAARNMLGRTPGNIVAVRPLRDGVISDYEMTEKMLEQFLKKINRFTLVKPRVVVSVPSGITEVEERAVIQAAMEAGARRVYLIEEPFAAALGAKMAISGPEGHMVVDIGGGTTDIAVLKVDGSDFPAAELGDSSQTKVGDQVVAIGTPYDASLQNTVTAGYISAVRDDYRFSSLSRVLSVFQHDAAINSGNSGGPLVNMYGQVVGINSSKIITDGYEGMGFAIPVSKAQAIINELLSGGYVKGRTRLGIQGKDVSAMQMMYGAPQGFVIMSIDSESAFSGTAAEDGDIITALDGEEVTGLSDISNLLLRYAPGDKVKITLYRMPSNSMAEGETFDVEITLLEDKGETQN